MFRRSLPHFLRLLAFSALLGGVWWAKETWGLELDAEALRAADAGWSPKWIGAYLLFWIIANSVLWPTLAGGVLFGWAGGTALGLVGAALAAAVQMTVIRTFLRTPAEAWFGERLVPLQGALEDRGLAVMVAWRLLWLPVSWITVAAALTRIPLWQHVAAVLAMAPGMLALCLVSDSLVVHGVAGTPAWRWAVFAAIFGASLGFWFWAQRRWPALRVSRATEG